MSQPPASDPWIVFRKPRPNARVRLLCFPFAGGGALAYRAWTTEMPEAIDVLPVQLPGRERRLREKPHIRMEALVDDLASVLVPYVDRPFAIFGHSMGSIVGYEVACRLFRDLGVKPLLLAVSARRAPHLPSDRDEDYKLPDDQLCDRLREMKGTPAEVLANPELMQLMLPLIRADFELNDTYDRPDHPPLDCPVSAFGGLKDAEVSREDLEAWSRVSTGAFKQRMFPGDHFYLHSDRPALIRAVAEDLLRLTD